MATAAEWQNGRITKIFHSRQSLLKTTNSYIPTFLNLATHRNLVLVGSPHIFTFYILSLKIIPKY